MRASTTCLLAADLETTMLGDGHAQDEFRAWYSHARQWLDLVYASRRPARQVERTISDEDLPSPVAIVAGTGTEVVEYPNADRIGTWPIPRATEWDAAAVAAEVGAVPELSLRSDRDQIAFRVSFDVHELTLRLLARIRHRLAVADVAADVVPSPEENIVDCVPQGVNKGSAVEYFTDHAGIAKQSVFVAVDARRDPALLRSPFRGIVVGNGDLDVSQLDPRTSRDVFVARRRLAAGVVDGLDHFSAQDVGTCG